jgi:hypothetical protein
MDLATIAAVVVLAAGVVAVTARAGRLVIVGLTVAALAAPFVASPLPGSLALTARILGALAAAAVMWVAVETGRVGSSGTAAGPVAEVAAAAAAFAVGLVVRPVDPLAGPLAAQAAGLALLVLAVVPLLGRDVFRLGAAIVLLTLGCSLLLNAWSGPPLPLQHLAVAALILGVAGATCLLAPAMTEPLASEVEEASVGGAFQPAHERPARPSGLPERQERSPIPAASRGPLAEPVTRPTGPAMSRPLEPPRAPAPRLPAVRPEPGPVAPAPVAAPEAASTPEPAPSSQPAAPPEPRPRVWTAETAEDEWAGWAAWAAPEPEPKDQRRPARKRSGGDDRS